MAITEERPVLELTTGAEPEAPEPLGVFARPTSTSGWRSWITTVDHKRNYHTHALMLAADEGFTPCKEVAIYEATPGCNNPAADHLSCAPASSEYAPEHVRSAVVRLAVRTEETDMSMEFLDVDVDAGIIRYNVAPPPDPTAYCPDVGVYKVRTLVTEVSIPNITARMASFAELPTGG